MSSSTSRPSTGQRPTSINARADTNTTATLTLDTSSTDGSACIGPQAQAYMRAANLENSATIMRLKITLPRSKADCMYKIANAVKVELHLREINDGGNENKHIDPTNLASVKSVSSWYTVSMRYDMEHAREMTISFGCLVAYLFVSSTYCAMIAASAIRDVFQALKIPLDSSAVTARAVTLALPIAQRHQLTATLQEAGPFTSCTLSGIIMWPYAKQLVNVLNAQKNVVVESAPRDDFSVQLRWAGEGLVPFLESTVLHKLGAALTIVTGTAMPAAGSAPEPLAEDYFAQFAAPAPHTPARAAPALEVTTPPSSQGAPGKRPRIV